MLSLIPPQVKLTIIGIFLLSLISGTAYVTHSIDKSTLLNLELKYKEAENQAVEAALAKQKAVDKLKNQQALEASKKQQQLVKQTQARLDEVNKYIKDNKYGCIDIGTIRLFNSTIQSDPTKRVPIPPGKSDDSCSGIRAAEFARTIIKDLGIAKQNAQQLNDLIQALKELKGVH